MSYSNYSEKRDFIRMQMNTNAILTDQNGTNYPCNCVDLSAAGVLVELDDEIDENAILHIEVPSKLENFSSLSAQCSIIRIERLSEGAKFRIALAINEMK